MLSTETVDDILIIKVEEKRLDAHRAPAFKDKVGGLIEKGASRLVLDLHLVEFVDSSGLGAIVSCLKRLGPTGNLVIVGANLPVRRLFALTRMDRVFSMHDTTDAAILSLNS
ncbi:STAS domain-containing protein [Devosia sp. A449]